MIIVIETSADGSAVRLDTPSDLKRFHVEAPAGADVDGALRAAEFGHLDTGGDGADAWVSVAAVRAAAADQVDVAEWTPQFEGMLGYARSKGWLNDDGTLIRAHIERV